LKKIVSANNPRFRALHKLAQSSRERRRQGLSLLDGIHLVAAYRDQQGTPRQLIVSESGSRIPEIQALLNTLGTSETWLLADGLFNRISPVSSPTGVLAVVETPRLPGLPAAIDACVLLEDIQDPGNLGSILRSAAAAGIKHVFLSEHSVHAWSPRVLRAGMGAHFMLAIHEGADLAALARDFDGKVVAATYHAGQTIYDTDLRGKVALLFGNEGAGLSVELASAAHERVAIPMPGRVESLNVAAAAAVCLFERVRQLRSSDQHSAVSDQLEARR